MKMSSLTNFCGLCRKRESIPNVIQESVFAKAGARRFDQAQPVQKRSPIRNRGRFCRSKGRDASAAKNRFLNHVRYLPNLLDQKR